MADVNAEINVNIDTSGALAQLKSLQREISRFHTSVAKSSDAAALAQRDLQKNFINGVNSIKGFSAELRTVKTTAESFTDSLERNKFSMREYFRYSMASTKTFGRLFSSELDTVNKVAVENVKRLQTQYIKMGRDASGAMKAIAVMPTKLDMSNITTQTQLAAQKQAIFNQLVKQGTTNLLNFGKNTQWAGRQLMVGFTLPLAGLGAVASRTFMDMESAAIKFKKVYGDLFTAPEETQFALDSIKMLGQEFTKYGIAVSQTVGLAAEAAAAGFAGADLQAQVTQATRLQVLGQVDQQKALETTIALQNAFRISSVDLADAINFLNAVENQTVVSLDDITTAIPKAAPVVRELGGDVRDLAFFMAAMKEGGINASQGANALKSGLASLINPTDKAKGMLNDMGIDIDNIVEKNVGNLKATVIEFAQALDGLSNLQRQRAIEQLFGKFQMARLSALFDNVIRDGNQASRVLDLASASMEDLASLAEKELGITADSAMNQFRASVESLKLALVPVGQTFLEIITPLLQKLNSVLDWFNGLSDTSKKVITKVILYLGGLAPVILMTIGLLANFVANGIKGLMLLRNGFLRLTGQSKILGEQTQYLTIEQQNAVAAAASLEQSHMKLQQAFTGEAGAVRQLITEYQRMIGTQNLAAVRFPGMMLPGYKPQGYADGIVSVPGPKGAGDVIPAMVSPGEAIIPAKMAQKYGGLINGMITDNIPGFASGLETQLGSRVAGQIPIFGEYAMRLQNPVENMSQRAGATSLGSVLAPLVARISEARGVTPSLPRIQAGELDVIAQEYTGIVEKFVQNVNTNFNDTYSEIKNSNERFATSWTKAGKDMEQEVNAISSSIDRGVVRKTFGLDPDIYSTIPTAPRTEGGTVPERARQGAFRRGKFGISSYTGLRPSIKALYGRITGRSGEGLQMGHVFGPQMTTIAALQQDPMRSSSVAKAAQVMNMQSAAITNQAIQTAEKVAQTKSPSKRTIKIGEDIARGLQVGMANQIDETKAMANNLSNAASGLINPKTGRPFTQQEVADLRRVSGSRVSGMVGRSGQTAFLGMPSFPEREGAAPRQTVRGRMRGAVARGAGRVGRAGGGFGLSGLIFALSMLPGKLGQMAQSIMPVVFGLQALGMVTRILGGWPTLLIAVGAGFFMLNKSAHKAAQEIADAAKLEAEARYGSAKAIEEYAEFTGRAVPSAREFSRNNRQLISASGEAVKRFAEFYGQKGNRATQVINAAAMRSPEAGVQAAAIDVAQRAAIFGLGPADIAANIKAAADLIGADQVELKAKIQTLLDPNGKDITKEPLTIKARMEFLSKESTRNAQAVQRAVEGISKIDVSAIQSGGRASGLTFERLQEAAGTQANINKAYSGGALGNTFGALQQVGAQISSTFFKQGRFGSDIDVIKEYANIQKQVQSAGLQASLAFVEQSESLALLNAQYADGIITEEEYNAAFNISLDNFTTLGESTKDLIVELDKLDSSGKLSADALKSLGNEAFKTLKKTNPELFKKITKSMEDLDASSQIEIMMGYAKGSLTILDVARIPELLDKINGKTVQAALKIISESDLSEGAKGTLSAAAIRPQIESLDKQIAGTSDMSDRARLLQQRSELAIDLANAIKRERDAAKVLQKGELDSDKVTKSNIDGTGKLLDLFDKELERLKRKRDALKAINDELDRQNQYQMKQMDLVNQAAKAKMTGDYLQAASLQQQGMFEGAKFTRESRIIQMDRLIDMVEKRKAKYEDTKRFTKSDKTFLDKIRSGNYSSLSPLPTTPNIGFGAKPGATGTPGTSIGGAVYNITMNVSGGNSEEVATKVLAKLRVMENKNNKSNKVAL